jgi:hypothetical protein
MRSLLLACALVVAPQLIVRIVPPQVTAVSPTTGSVGTSLTITGSNFGLSQENSTVTINGSPAAVMSWSETQLVVVIPATTTGPLVVTRGGRSSGGLTITVGSGESFFVAQTAAGSGDASSCANAKAITFFNTAANWGAGTGKVSGGDTVFLCGALTSTLTVQGDGTAGNPIVIDGTSATMTNVNVAISSHAHLTLQHLTWADGPTIHELVSLTGVQDVILDSLRVTNWANTTADGDIIFIHHNSPVTDGLTIRNSYLETTTGSTGFQTDVIGCEGGCQNVVIQGNYIAQQAADDTQHDDGVQTFCGNACPGTSGWVDPQNWTFRWNKFVINSTAANNKSWHMVEATAGTNFDYGNLYYGKAGGSSVNPFQNSGTGTWVIANDTFVCNTGLCGSAVFSTLTASQTVTNIVVQSLGGSVSVANISAGPTLTFSLFKGGTGSFNVPTSGQCPTGCLRNIDPLFTNASRDDFSLGTGSPALGAGTNLGSPYDVGPAPGATWPNPALLTRGSSWDLGAFCQTGCS